MAFLFLQRGVSLVGWEDKVWTIDMHRKTLKVVTLHKAGPAEMSIVLGKPPLALIVPFRSMWFILSFLYFISVFYILYSFSSQEFLIYEPFITEAFPDVFCFTSGKANNLMFFPVDFISPAQYFVPLYSHFPLGLQMTSQSSSWMGVSALSLLWFWAHATITDESPRKLKTAPPQKKNGKKFNHLWESTKIYRKKQAELACLGVHNLSIAWFYSLFPFCLYQTHQVFF